MDPTNYFETPQHRRMDQILNQVFDTLSDKIRIAHAKDVKRSGDDKSEKHADIGDADALESAHVPRRRRDRAAGARPRLAQLRPLSEAARARSTRTFPIIIEHLVGRRRPASEEIPRRQAPGERPVTRHACPLDDPPE